MPVIRFPSRRGRGADVVHATPPRVGIFVIAARARSTGPQAHESPYIADEERVVRGQVMHALGRLTMILAGAALGAQVFGFVKQIVIALGWIAP